MITAVGAEKIMRNMVVGSIATLAAALLAIGVLMLYQKLAKG